MLRLGKITLSRGGDLRRFYTTQHTMSCGIARHARTLDLWILSQPGEIMVHQHCKASPDAFLKVIAPSRDALVVAVAGLCTWYWLADLCAREGIPLGRGAFP